MSATESFKSAWIAYEDAVNELYTPPDTEVPDRGAAEIYAEHLEAGGDTVLERAGQVRTVLTAAMDTEDREQRELASLKLLSAAAYDLSVAGDLLELDETDPTAEPDRGARGAMLAAEDLYQVLDAPFEEGMLGILDFDRAALPKDAQGARKALEKEIASILEDVPDDAADLSQKVLAGVVTLGLAPLQGAASVAIQEILAHVPEGVSAAVRGAAKVVIEAITKLRAAIGEEQEEEIREEAVGWLEELQEKRDTVTGLLDKLYETERIGQGLTEALEAAPEGTDAARYNQATKQLEELLARYGKAKKVLSGLMTVLAFVSKPLLGAVPWGPIAVYATYAGIFGYAIFSGGDYLDWYRLEKVEWLDRVEGVRTTVNQAFEETE